MVSTEPKGITMATFKALIEILNKKLVNSILGDLRTDQRLPREFRKHQNCIPVQFNPAEYSLTSGTQNSKVKVPERDASPTNFVETVSDTLSLELFFDTTEYGAEQKAIPGTIPDRAFLSVNIKAGQYTRHSTFAFHLGKAH